jgi:predicted nuclease of predicted toxin-antitoxin system
MHIKVDEDLPRVAVKILRDRGHQAVSVLEQGMGGWKDAALWQAVQAEHRYLVTADKGFGDVRLYAPGTHAGILLLRPDQDGIRPTIELLERVLESYDLESLSGTIAVVSSRGMRIRRAKG